MLRLLGRSLLLALVGAAASCGPGGAAHEHDALTSWAATVEAAADQWASGALPGRFADETLEQVQQRLAAESQKIERVQSTPDSIAALRQALGEADRSAAQALAAVQSGTPAAGRDAAARAARLRTALQR